jgi:hypothetical protein
MPYADANDRVKHMNVIERLASEIDRPVTEVTPLYEDILSHMRDVATIQDYLPLLVSKRVKRVFKK